MNRNAWIVIIVIVVLGLVGWMIYASNHNGSNTAGEYQQTTSPTVNDQTPSASSAEATVNAQLQANPATQPAPQPKTDSFTITGQNFSFNPKSITVNKGDTVKITFVNSSGTHDLHVEGYGAGTKVLQSGQSETITFVADKNGDFQYYCAVGNHRAMGMWGTMHVI